jgi:hypothetical protein
LSFYSLGSVSDHSETSEVCTIFHKQETGR